MRIALFSDIHANLPALEAFFQDIDRRSVDAVYCLGDLVGYNIWPNEVIQAIRQRNIPCITGNYDFGIGRQSDDCGCAYKTEEEKANGAVSISLTNELIGEEERKYLRTLPTQIRVDLPCDDGPLQLLLVHGSPRRINEYLFEDRDEKSLLRIMEEARADILCFGHTHRPYHRVLTARDSESPVFRHAINIGSVGKPKDGDPRGCYVILTTTDKSSKREVDSIHVEFIRFEYDIEKSARAVEDSRLPDVYVTCLREGK